MGARVEDVQIGPRKDLKDKTYIKFILVTTRKPEVGDKMVTRHGQKGVISAIINSEVISQSFTARRIIHSVLQNYH